MATAHEPDLLDTDPLDPAVLEAHEAELKKKENVSDDVVRQHLNRRKEAYAAVFTPGKRTQADIDIVLNDLQYFCKVWVPSYNIAEGQHAEELSKRKEGRREVFLRIKDFTRLDSDALLIKYTDAIKPK